MAFTRWLPRIVSQRLATVIRLSFARCADLLRLRRSVSACSIPAVHMVRISFLLRSGYTFGFPPYGFFYLFGPPSTPAILNIGHPLFTVSIQPGHHSKWRPRNISFASWLLSFCTPIIFSRTQEKKKSTEINRKTVLNLSCKNRVIKIQIGLPRNTKNQFIDSRVKGLAFELRQNNIIIPPHSGWFSPAP